MKSITRHIPNFITSLNLLSGSAGIVFLMVEGIGKAGAGVRMACYMVFIASVFDFFDGLSARALKAYSDIGKDLDSLADVVSFGVLPSLILVNIYLSINQVQSFSEIMSFVPAIFLIIPVFSALRLARFNNDPEQTSYFKGLAVPASGLFIASVSLFILSESISDANTTFTKIYTSNYFLLLMPVILSTLMVSRLKLISFKIKNFSVKKYIYHILFLLSSIITGIFVGFASAPIILILYIVFSQLYFRFNKHEIQS